MRSPDQVDSVTLQRGSYDPKFMSLGPATMFTGVAVSIFCPAAIARIGDPTTISNFANGQLPITLPILGG
jgi:hypothetical protein